MSTIRSGLVITGDSKGAEEALAAVDRGMEAAEGSAQQYAAAFRRADAEIGRLAAAQAAATREVAAAKAAYTSGSSTLEQYKRQVLETKSGLSLVAAGHQSAMSELKKAEASYKAASSGLDRVTVSAGQQKAGMQQLSYQLNDVATMFAMGAKPQQIFASQAGQVIQAVQLMTGGTSRLAGFLGGPWGMAMMTATVVMVPFIGKLMETASKADEATAALDALIKKRREETADRLAGVQQDMGLNKLVEERAALEIKIEERRRQNRQYGAQQDAFLYKELTRLNELNGIILEGEAGIRAERQAAAAKDNQNLGSQIANRAKLAGATTAAERAQAQYTLRVQEANSAFEKSAKTDADQQKLLEALTSAEGDLSRARDKGDRSAQNRTATLARESVATETLTRSLYAAAEAYRMSAAEGMRAEIIGQAVSQGIKKRADQEAFAATEMAKALAQRSVEAAKQVADLNAQAEAQEFVNAQVLQGVIDAGAASTAIGQIMERRAAGTALAAAETGKDVAAVKALSQSLSDLTAAQLRSNTAAVAAQDIQRSAQLKEEALFIQNQITLTKALGEAQMAARKAYAGPELEEQMARLNVEHEKAAIRMDAQTKAALELKGGLKGTADETLRNADARVQLADIKAQFDAEARGADGFADAMRRLHDISRDISFGDVFGGFGDALDGVLFGMDKLVEAQEAYRTAVIASAGDAGKLAAAESALGDAKLSNTVRMLGASKRMFSEQSAGYKAITTLETVLAAIKMANSIRSIAMDATQTASSVANSTVRAAADQAAGASKMFGQLGVFAFPAVAAMLALLGGLGVKGGGGGGSAGYTPPSADDLQAGLGTGTVLGDSRSQSESLGNALGILAENSVADLEYSNEMVRQLRSIDMGINKLTGQIGRQIGLAGSAFDTSSFKLGTTGSSGLLGLIGGGSTTRSLYDQGIQVFNQSIADILAEGVEAQVYNVIEQVKTSNGFLGIGGGTKTSYQTMTGAVPGAIEEQMRLIVGDVSKSVITLAGQVGLDVAEFVRSVQLPETKLSFKDMSGDEIEAALQAYFSSIADQIAAVAGDAFDPAGSGMRLGLDDLQRAGEGLFETLSRVSRTMMTVDGSLRSIGMEPLTVGGSRFIGATAPAADNLVGQFGGLDPFQEAVAAFSKTFLTEAERMAPVISSVRAEMDRLGQSGVTTNDQFKALVLGLDLGTASGQEMFGSLMAVAPAFGKVTEYLGSLDQALEETGQSAAELAQEQRDIRAVQIQIMEAQGRTAEAEAARQSDALAGATEAMRPWLAALYEARNAATLATAAAKEATDIRAIQIQIMEAEGRTIEAEAARRTDALNAASEGMRPWLQALYDARDAANDAAAAQQKANASRSLDIRLAEAMGRTADAMRMKMEDFVNSFDPDLRGKAQQVWDAEARGVAAKTNRQVTEDAYATLDAARKAFFSFGGFADKHAWRAADPTGHDAAANAYSLASEAYFAAIPKVSSRTGDPTAGYYEALRKADEERLARKDGPSDEKREEARQAALARANMLRDKEIAILEMFGRTSEAVALKRQAEVAAAEAQMRPVITLFHEMENIAARQAELAGEVAKARDVLTRSYERERAEIGAMADQLGTLGAGLREYRASIHAGQPGDEAGTLRAAQVAFMQASAQANTGDVEAAGKLATLGRDVIERAFAQAENSEQAERQRAFVTAAIDQAITAVGDQEDFQRAQLKALEKAVEGLLDQKDETIAVREAIEQLEARLAAQASDQAIADVKIAEALGTLSKLARAIDRQGGIAVVTDDDSPLRVTVMS